VTHCQPATCRGILGGLLTFEFPAAPAVFAKCISRYTSVMRLCCGSMCVFQRNRRIVEQAGLLLARDSGR
jgi:hypothetical protein